MSTTTNALKDHFADGVDLMIFLSGIGAMNQMIGDAAMSGELNVELTRDASYLLVELAAGARNLVEDAQNGTSHARRSCADLCV
ncbi:hypothetical protein ACVBEF_18500 [Glaciimonas sp. GG7]